MNNKKCFIMGLPNAGKTTYLGALWHSLNSPAFHNKLKLHKIYDNKYIADLGKKWLNVDQVGRTNLGYENINISIEVVDNNNNISDIWFPDLSGETFQDQYVNRNISNELADYIKTSDGILMFINIGDIDEISFISDLPSTFNEADYESETNIKKIRDPKKDDQKQVQIIELLQFVFYIRKCHTNIGIILSAWDLLNDIENKISPEEFVKKNMSMLWQFLESNKNKYNTSYWGVSALGDKFENEEILLNIKPENRIQVVSNNKEKCNDITLPIYEIVGE